MKDFTLEELEIRIAVCKKALEWLHSDDPMLKDAEYAALVPGAIENYTNQLKELVEARQRKLAEGAQAEPVTVGLKAARLTPKVLGG